jgi:hypothetical protein
MDITVQFDSLNQTINTHLFNKTRKFLRLAGVEYTVDMKRQYIFVNNGVNSAFSLKFETYNYVRVAKIPRGKIEILFLATSPEFIIKRLFDYRYIHLSEVSRMMNAVHRPPGQVVEAGPIEKIDHNPPSEYDIFREKTKEVRDKLKNGNLSQGA